MNKEQHKGFSTKAIHSGFDPSEWPGSPVICGISLSTTFKQNIPGVYTYDYSRSGNPTRDTLEKTLASLEDAKYGLTFSSGLAAESCVIHLLNSGDEILCMDDVYGGTNRLFNKVFQNFQIKTRMVDCCNPHLLKQAISPQTKMIWIESPTNPMLKIIDIKAIREIIDSEDQKILLVVDNTFMTPYFQMPLHLGAHISLHSVTKYLNGHSDVVMGVIMLNDKDIYERLRFLQNAVGSIPSPFECYLTLRGLKTLSIRMERHQQTALKVAHFLEQHPSIEKVIYPGLPSHPQHELCKKQCSGYSGIVTVIIKGDSPATVQFLQKLKIFSVAESLGGFESLADYPAIMTHSSVPLQQRLDLGISDSLVRLSVGLEDAEDLIHDLDQALNHSKNEL